ncbi:uncharacterized protein LOC106157572 [Lingula anatina]|uniref:Uncharacterized protein LOC106157572 n=1 Tax=Lingula anatina TaxID=7574 RepID=A0A1S3HRR2_LINAN|nr:uncharacterized protein LOC106157572 [Lingula anatina]|eukprot:XP_013388720.1 uncharacterized protein LOC106157572 [Lingula anatina]
MDNKTESVEKAKSVEDSYEGITSCQYNTPIKWHYTAVKDIKDAGWTCPLDRPKHGFVRTLDCVSGTSGMFWEAMIGMAERWRAGDIPRPDITEKFLAFMKIPIITEETEPRGVEEDQLVKKERKELTDDANLMVAKKSTDEVPVDPPTSVLSMTGVDTSVKKDLERLRQTQDGWRRRVKYRDIKAVWEEIEMPEEKVTVAPEMDETKLAIIEKKKKEKKRGLLGDFLSWLTSCVRKRKEQG